MTQRVVAAVVVIGVGSGAWLLLSKKPWQHRELHQRQLTSNPANDPVGTGVISPDGKTLAVVDHFHPGLSLRAIDSGESHTVDLPEGFAFNLLIPLVDWYPDGSQLLVSGNMSDGTPCVWAVPVVGGRARKLRGDGDGATISRDGSRLAYVRTGDAGNDLWCAGIDGQNAHRIAVSDSTGLIITWAAWSPNGSRLAYARVSGGPGGTQVLIESCDLDGNRRRVFSSSPEQALHVYTILLWTRMVGFVRAHRPASRSARHESMVVARRSVFGGTVGEAARVTRWRDCLRCGRRESQRTEALERESPRVPGRLLCRTYCAWRLVAPGCYAIDADDRMDLEPAWMPDGKSILFSSDRNGTSDIFRQSLATGAEPLVTGPGDQSGPSSRPTARGLFLDVVGEKDHGANQTPAHAGTHRRRTGREGVRHPARGAVCCARAPVLLCVVSTKDGRRRSSPHSIRCAVWVGVDSRPGGERTDVLGSVSRWNRPGVRCQRDAACDSHRVLARRCDARRRRPPRLASNLAWNADGTGWVVVGINPDENAWSLYHVAPDGGTTKLLPPQMWMYGAAVSPDGRHIAFTSNTVDGNVWLLEDF